MKIDSPSRDTLDFPSDIKINKVLIFNNEKWEGEGVNIAPATTITSGTSAGQWCSTYVLVNKPELWKGKNRTSEPSVADGPLTYTEDKKKLVRWADETKQVILGKYQGHSFKFYLS